MIETPAYLQFRAPPWSRALDLAVAALGLLLLLPLFALVGAAIKLQDGGPIFYHALRVGRSGRSFYLRKFRTMAIDADRVGPAITAHGDGRITPVGGWLRRTKIDELPQLVNVVRGEMSLVGPRPEDPRYVALYTPEQARVLDVLPGITSAASLEFRHEQRLLVGPDWERVYREDVLPAKLQTDLDYLRCRTIWSDIALIARTIAAMAAS